MPTWIFSSTIFPSTILISNMSSFSGAKYWRMDILHRVSTGQSRVLVAVSEACPRAPEPQSHEDWKYHHSSIKTCVKPPKDSTVHQHHVLMNWLGPLLLWLGFEVISSRLRFISFSTGFQYLKQICCRS